jgi:hypothetical protein
MGIGCAMPVDRATLDEAVRRFPMIVRRYRLYLEACHLPMSSRVPIIERVEASAIRLEYRIILAERAKSERKAA